MNLPGSLRSCAKEFQRLPGIGEKTALRMAFSLMGRSAEKRSDLATAIEGLNQLKKCQDCRCFAEEEQCEICRDPKRKDAGILCIVETMSDLLAIERSSQFRGVYFCLGGVLNPLLGIGPQELGIPEFVKKVSATSSLERVVFALNPTVEGDATCSYLKEQLVQVRSDVAIERIGFGIPMGSNLEFLDNLTITKAFENRKLLL